MNLFEEVKNLSRRSVLEEMLKVRSMVIPAPDVSKFGAFDEFSTYTSDKTYRKLISPKTKKVA